MKIFFIDNSESDQDTNDKYFSGTSAIITNDEVAAARARAINYNVVEFDGSKLWAVIADPEGVELLTPDQA